MIPPLVYGITGFIGTGKGLVATFIAYSWLYSHYCPDCRIHFNLWSPPYPVDGQPPAVLPLRKCPRCGVVSNVNLAMFGHRVFTNYWLSFAAPENIHPFIADHLADNVLSNPNSDVKTGIVLVDESSAEVHKSRGVSTRNILWVNFLEQIRKRNLAIVWIANTEGMGVPYPQIYQTQIAIEVDSPIRAEGRFASVYLWDRYGRHMGEPNHKPYQLIPARKYDRKVDLHNLDAFFGMYNSGEIKEPSVAKDKREKAAKKNKVRNPITAVREARVDVATLPPGQQAAIQRIARWFADIDHHGVPLSTMRGRFQRAGLSMDIMREEIAERNFLIARRGANDWVVPAERGGS